MTADLGSAGGALDLALLAPVIDEDLEWASTSDPSLPHIVFGSKRWEFFAELDVMRAQDAVPVLLYRSRSAADGVSKIEHWAWYLGSVRSDAEKREDEKLGRRPAPAIVRPDDSASFWPVFWRISRPMTLREAIPIHDLILLKGGKRHARSAPRSPPLVHRPPSA